MWYIFLILLAGIGWWRAGIYSGRYNALYKEYEILRDHHPEDWMWKWIQNGTRPEWASGTGVSAGDLNDLVAGALRWPNPVISTEDEFFCLFLKEEPKNENL
jgi:hypothetical protein